MQNARHNIPMKEFELFTDAARMQGIFQQQLPAFSQGNLVITDCQILRTRYRTYLKQQSRGKTSLSVCYRLDVTDASQHRCGVQLLYAKVYLGERSRLEYHTKRTASLVSPQFGQALVHLPELDVLVWAFPNDPQLPHLPEVIDPKRVLHHLPYDCLPMGIRGPHDLTGVTAEVLHYYPEVRCTTRYRLQWGPPETPRVLTLIGKTFKDETGRAVYDRMERLQQATLEDRGVVRVARPLSYHPTIKTLWQQDMPGAPLIDHLDRAQHKDILESVATGLARLHHSDLSSSLTYSLSERLTEVRKKSAKLRHAFPDLGKSLPSLVRDLEQSAPRLTPVSDRLIHGDFHIRQLLIHEGKIIFLDFDEFAIGDPLQDLASFMVDLYFYSFARDDVKLMGTTFYRAYKAQVGWVVPVDRLNWSIQMQFITKAYRAYLQQEPELEERIHHIISLAQQGMYLDPDTRV